MQHPPVFRLRLKNTTRFLAIVLALAGGFQLISAGVMGLFETALMGGGLEWLVGKKLLSAPRGLEVSPEETAREARRAVEADARFPLARLASFRMGCRHGLASFGYGQLAAYPNDERSEAYARVHRQNEAAAEELATALAVSPPKAVAPKQQLNALTEFRHRLEDDATGRALREAYSVQHAALFRLGALAGYEHGERVTIGKALPVFDLEIASVAPVTGLPESLWRPLTRGRDDIEAAGVEKHFLALVAEIETHLTPPE